LLFSGYNPKEKDALAVDIIEYDAKTIVNENIFLKFMILD
jgi:hypothetical protein